MPPLHSPSTGAFLLRRFQISPPDAHDFRPLHARLVLSSVPPSNLLASKLISFYSRLSLLDDSRLVFDSIPHKSVFAFNSLLLAYSIHRRPVSALSLFKDLVGQLAPDAVSVSTLLKTLSSSAQTFDGSPKDWILGDGPAKGWILGGGSTSVCGKDGGLRWVDVGRSIHGFVVSRGFERDLFVSNGLVTFYSRFRELGCARKVFDFMSDRDVVSWNSMVSGYAQGGLYEECLKLFRQMEVNSDGLKPNNVTIVSALQACAQLKDLDIGTRICGKLEDGNMDLLVWNSVLSLYAKCRELDHAKEVFEAMPENDQVSYNVMLSGYFSCGFVDEGMRLFGKMSERALSTWNTVISGLAVNNCHKDVLKMLREMQQVGCQPNAVTISSALSSVSYFSNLLVGKQVHCYAIRNNFDRSIYVVASLIDTYAKSGFIHGACRIFTYTRARNVIGWTSIISAHAAHGDADSAITMFNKMIECGIKPDSVTFTAVLAACAHSGAVSEAQRIFNTMSSKYGLIPTAENFACMVTVMSRAGMLEEAVKFIGQMPIEPNAKAWGALLNGASIAGNVEIARLAFEHLIVIEPESDGNYIIMANVYSKVGKWSEATRTREEMRKAGLGKSPGCSWIETSNGSKNFVALDTSTNCSEDVYDVLGVLVEMMIEGYGYSKSLDEESLAVIL